MSDDEILLSTDKGSMMRCAVKEIRIAGRNTQGVRIKKLSGSEKVVSVIKIEDNIKMKTAFILEHLIQLLMVILM